MARVVRFVVDQRISHSRRPVGVFTAAYHLRRDGELLRHDHERLSELLAWFEAELTIPPRGAIPPQAIFWYRDVGPFAQRMWDLVQLLREYGYTAELITATFIGRVVYRDAHQYAAIPPRHDHR